MEDNISTKKQPNLPSNYVTLAQLQQRWIKQKEKEEQKQNKLHNEEAQPQQAIPRNSNRNSNHRNLIGSDNEESNAVSVEENEDEKSEEMKKNKGKERKGEARALEEVTKGSEAHGALLVKSEKKNVGYERKREMRMEYRAKVEKMVVENNQAAKIEIEFGDLSIEKESEKSNSQNRVINGRNSYANGGDRNYRGYNDGGDRGNGQYRGGYGRFNHKNGRYGGGHVRFNGNGQQKGRDNGKVWVKKEKVADGGDMAGNQSSSGSWLKGLE